MRVNLGLFQHDVNVIWDLAIHDLSIMDYVLPDKAGRDLGTGISHVPGQPENVAYITLFFANPQIAHVHVNWLTPVKVRHTLIGGSEKMILYDDLEPSEKVKVYDKGITVTPGPEDVYKMLVSYRSGDMWAPRLDNTEALQTEALHFIDCIENNKQPETDGPAGLRMVNMIEAAETSLRDRGRVGRDPVVMHQCVSGSILQTLLTFHFSKRSSNGSLRRVTRLKPLRESLLKLFRWHAAAGFNAASRRRSWRACCLGEGRNLDESRVGACGMGTHASIRSRNQSQLVFTDSRGARAGNQNRHADGLRVPAGKPSRLSSYFAHHRPASFPAKRLRRYGAASERCAGTTERRKMFISRTFNLTRCLPRGCVSLASTRIMCWS